MANLGTANDLHSSAGDAQDQDKLVFPINVHDSLQSSAGLRRENQQEERRSRKLPDRWFLKKRRR